MQLKNYGCNTFNKSINESLRMGLNYIYIQRLSTNSFNKNKQKR